MNPIQLPQPPSKRLRKGHIAAVGLALFAGSLFLIVVEYASLRSSLVSNLEVQMRIVGHSSVAALLFHDKESAKENVATLSSSPDIDAVALYNLGQQRFAEYIRKGTTADSLSLRDLDKPFRRTGLYFTEIWLPVTYASNPMGTLYVRANLNRLYQQLLWYMTTTAAVMLATLLAAALLLGRLQRAVVHAEERVGYLANYDMVTHLPNRYSFNQHFQTLLGEALANNSVLALLVLDLDDFKVINDTLGHHVGDTLLRIVAQRLMSVVRHEDVIYRVGGDEFAMILNHAEDVERVDVIAEKFIRVLSAPIVINERNLYVGVSIGASMYPHDGNDVAQLLKDADAAMYHAKSRGKNKFQMFSEEMHYKTSTRLALESELRIAMEEGQFELYYQPQVALPSRRLIGAEALIRWNHPEKGLLLPASFIPTAEETGLIVPIGQWVLRTTCEHMRAWAEQRFRPIRISVNLSGRQFREDRLIESVTNILQETKINPDLLEFEITESVLMDDAESTVARLASLRAMGIHLAIDDFGTGYSSMTYIKRFPVGRLKIDRSFIRDIPDDSDDMAITLATIQMAHSLKLEVVAEGIETAPQVEFLCERNCDIGQGYLFSVPLNVKEMTDLLRSGLLLLEQDAQNEERKKRTFTGNEGPL
ncbi:MAG TPA: EAL domain-containing protein [Methylophilaceae bacterium]|nr:EAL domain-containing protein [Methylophilaceae bacterium]